LAIDTLKMVKDDRFLTIIPCLMHGFLENGRPR